jgi:allantoinase
VIIRARRAVVDGVTRACAVEVHNGVVARLLEWDTPVDDAIELADDEVLLPGLVDTHVHVNEPGRTAWEGFESATRAAAAGGVTTILDMPLNSIPPTIDVDALERKRIAADGKCHVDVGFWGGAVPANLGALRPLHEAGAFGCKAFLVPSGVDEFPPLSDRQLMTAMHELAEFDGLLIVHAEAPELIGDAQGPEFAGFAASRPQQAEVAAVSQVINAARVSGGRAHIVHLAAAEALALLADARADGVRITAETCPHYLALTADEVPASATEFKCCPPIRDGANRDALWAGLASGVLEAIVSDHSPAPASLKLLGDFGKAWGGIASLQLGLPIVWTEARARGVQLADVARWMASGPADLVGLEQKGRIAVGADADLVAFAPDESFIVDPSTLLHRHPITPYAGRKLTGVVRRTWLRGVETDGTPRGKLLVRGGR